MRRISTLTVCVIVLMGLIWGASPAASVQADAGAISPGCAFVNQNGALNEKHISVDTDQQDLVFYAGEVITVTMTGGQPTVLDIYNWDTPGVMVKVGDGSPVSAVTTITWTVPTTQIWNLSIGFDGTEGDSTLFGTAVCQPVVLPPAVVLLRTITVWGPVGIRAVSWQYEDSSGHWWWVYQADNSTRVQTPIEFRERVRDGKIIPHYALSRLTTTSTATQNDPKTYRAFNADTLAPLHQVWIEIGSEADPNRLSVFIP